MKGKLINLKSMIIMFTLALTMMATTIVSFAVDPDFKDIINYQSLVEKYLKTASDATHKEEITFTVNGKQVTYYYNSAEKNAALADIKKIVESDAGTINGNNFEENREALSKKITSVNDGMGMVADTGAALDLMSGFMGVIRTLLGIIVVAVTVGMTIFSSFDLAYIAFPVFRNKCEEHKQNGGALASQGKKGANGETKLRFVSDDAQYAVVAADTVQSGKNPFVIYFSKRLMSYIVLAILIFILMTGKVTVFTDLGVNLVSGIINAIQGI